MHDDTYELSKIFLAPMLVDFVRCDLAMRRYETERPQWPTDQTNSPVFFPSFHFGSSLARVSGWILAFGSSSTSVSRVLLSFFGPDSESQANILRVGFISDGLLTEFSR